MTSTKRKATGERRLEIIQVARDILTSEGFHKLTLRNIAKKVGINLSSLQYHFKNRAALIETLIAQAYKYDLTRARNMFKIEPAVDPRLQIGQEIRSHLDLHKSMEKNQFFNQIVAMAIEEPAAQELIDDFYQRIWTIMSDLLPKLNPSLDEEERLNRSAQMLSLLEGSGFIIGSPRLRGKLPESYYDHIVDSVIKLMFE
jgi:AcrR family transcriptional regulator